MSCLSARIALAMTLLTSVGGSTAMAARDAACCYCYRWARHGAAAATAVPGSPSLGVRSRLTRTWHSDADEERLSRERSRASRRLRVCWTGESRAGVLLHSQCSSS